MSLRDQLYGIRAARGVLTPEVVVEEAAPEEHPLHHRFEWDNNVAGHKYRVGQAEDLIRSIKVVQRPATDKEPALVQRAFVAPRDPARPNEYMPIEEVAQDPFLRSLYIKQLENEWREFKRRYDGFEEFWPIIVSDAPAELATV